MRALTSAKISKLNRTVYCGPYAVSSITGKHVEVIEYIINKKRNKSTDAKVSDTSSHDLFHVLEDMGFSPTYEWDYFLTAQAPTFAKWLRERGDMTSPYLVLVTGHWIAVKGRKMVDTFTREPTFIRRAPHRRKRVHIVIKVRK